MNTSQFMDKQIMDLTSSSSLTPSLKQNDKHNDENDIDLATNHHHLHHQESETDPNQLQQQQSGSLYDINCIISGNESTINGDDIENGIKKEEIVPSYDFHPIRPITTSSINNNNNNNSTTLDSKSNLASFPLGNYGSLDSIGTAKVIVENNQKASDDAAMSEIEKTMKKYTDNLVHILEGVSARLTQLECRSRHLENTVDELKVSISNSLGNTDGKIERVENVLIKLQAGVEILKDKHEMLEAELKLAGLQVSKSDHQQPDIQNVGHMGAMQQTASSPPPQSHHQFPHATFPQSSPPVPVLTNAHPPPSITQQNFPPPASLPSHFPPSQIPSVPQKEPYYSPQGQTQESPAAQYQITSSQHLQSSSAAPNQPYEPAPQPQYSKPPQLSQHQTSVGHHPGDAPYVSSQSYPPSLRQPSSQPPSGAPPSHPYYGAPSHTFDQPPSRSSSGFSAGYNPPSGAPEPYPSGGSPAQYGNNPTMKLPQFLSPALSQSGGSGYPQLPTARPLPIPHSLPAASGVSGSPGSPGTGNRVPIDDVVDKVSTMGFPREQVRATVRKLTENGQAVDLNTVLDKLMNDGEIQPQRGWFGR